MLILFFLFILITEFNSIEIELEKLSNQNNEYNPYIFNFTLKNNETYEIIKYPSIFDTTRSYILIQEDNEQKENDINNTKNNTLSMKYNNLTNYTEYEIKINETTIYYYKTIENITDKGILGIIGLSNKNRNYGIKIKKEHNYSFLNILPADTENPKFINFIQKEDDEAIIQFGGIDSRFKTGHSRKCNCNGRYWSCELSSLKIGGKEILTPTSPEFAIF